MVNNLLKLIPYYHEEVTNPEKEIESRGMFAFFPFFVLNFFTASTNKKKITSEWCKKKKFSNYPELWAQKRSEES